MAWCSLCPPSSPAASCSGLFYFRPLLDMAPVSHVACARRHPYAKPGPAPAQVIKTKRQGTPLAACTGSSKWVCVALGPTWVKAPGHSSLEEACCTLSHDSHTCLPRVGNTSPRSPGQTRNVSFMEHHSVTVLQIGAGTEHWAPAGSLVGPSRPQQCRGGGQKKKVGGGHLNCHCGLTVTGQVPWDGDSSPVCWSPGPAETRQEAGSSSHR